MPNVLLVGASLVDALINVFLCIRAPTRDTPTVKMNNKCIGCGNAPTGITVQDYRPFFAPLKGTSPQRAKRYLPLTVELAELE